jgi:hypothetical protein
VLAATLIAIFLIPVSTTSSNVSRIAAVNARAGRCARWRELSGSASARSQSASGNEKV